MGRFLVVSYQPYRTYHLELREGGAGQCAVIIHPPAGKGQAHEVPQASGATSLVELIGRAKGMIDEILGPRPQSHGFGPRRQHHLASF
jgi:hypothetical protein